MSEKRLVLSDDKVFKLVENREDFVLSRSEVLERDLSRYYYLVFVSQLRIYEKLTTEEIYAIIATCNSAMYGSNISDGLLRSSVAEAYKYGVLSGIGGLDDIKPLLDKMAEWSLIDQFATIDLAERYWAEASKDINSISTPEELKEMLLKEHEEILRYLY